MKIKSLRVSFLLAVAICAGSIVFSDNLPKAYLTKVEVFNSDISTQLMLFFSEPIDFKATKDVQMTRFSVLFGNTNLGNYDKEALVRKMRELGFVQNVLLERVGDGVRLNVDFTTDQVYVKMFPLENKTRYIIEIYSLPALRKLQKSSEGPLLYAFNDYASPFGNNKKKTLNDGFLTSARIVIDAGHGGDACGARGLCGLIEKDVALDVAQKMKKFLSHIGYNVILTRNNDRDVSLLKRCEIAQENKADLFLSVHANSAGDSKEPFGIETFHLNSFPFYSVNYRNEGFEAFFTPDVSHDMIRRGVDEVVHIKDEVSYQLAQNVQNTLISVLHNKKYDVNNRGVKKAQFHVLLRGDIPAALVEVGFITNPEEAQRLASGEYRSLVAKAICFGVHRFLNRGESNEI